MKLFQQMLVAGASLSLLTPVIAQASDVNLEEMNSYSRSTKSSKKRFDSKTFSNEIVKINEDVLENHPWIEEPSLEDILELGSWVDKYLTKY